MAFACISSSGFLLSRVSGSAGRCLVAELDHSFGIRDDAYISRRGTTHFRPMSMQSLPRLSKEPDFSSSLANSPLPSSSCSPFPEDWWRSPPQLQIVCPTGSRPEISELRVSRMSDTESIIAAPSSSDWHISSCDWKEFEFHETPTSRGTAGGVPVYVMLPLDSVNMNNTLNRRRALNASLLALKSAGVEGIMMDVWWGIVEKDAPGQYNWSAYKELIDLVRKYGLKVQAVMSFHQCGGNVGDSCFIPLPQWVTEEIHKNPDIVYTDKSSRRNHEYLSLGCDVLPVLQGRSPVQTYADFMRSFRDTFAPLLGEVINEIQVGMGPAGELRYPAYPESNGRWRFPGIGEFQCYDKYMMASLKACAEAVGRSHWGLGGPHDAGNYNQWPDETGFFHRDGSWNSPYGQFFLEWYSGMLIAHGERILSAAEGIFRGTGAHISGKVAGIHWHYGTRSHAAELTAGYYNTRIRDGYVAIAHMFARHGVTLNFTCIEMRDTEQPPHALCSPEGLLRQIAVAARTAGIRLSGENALPRFDESAHDQVVRKSRLQVHEDGSTVTDFEPMCSFTFLRMCERLFHNENWRVFVPFVRHMGEGRTFQPWEEEHQDTVSHVHATKPLIQEAAAALMYH